MKYEFISRERVNHKVRRICKVLKVSEQGYYASLRRPESKRSKANKVLGDKIQVKFADHKKRYGSPRIVEELRDDGERCGKHRVARIMNERGLRAKAARKFRVTTQSLHEYPVAPNVLQRNFTTSKPDEVWVGDITYLHTEEGWMYLAVLIDLFSRKVVGWALSSRLTGSVVHLAFERACARRNPSSGLMIHTDRGVQYAAAVFRRMLADKDITLSMSRLGNCWDNAVAESFFKTLKVESIYGERFDTRAQLSGAVFEYIERYYNRRRKHSTIGYHSPEEYERKQKNQEMLAA